LQPSQQVFIGEDGEVVVRFEQTDEHPLFQVYRVLAIAQSFARQVFSRLEIPTLARLHVVLNLHAGRMRQTPVLPGFFNTTIEGDIEAPFADAFGEALLRIYRAEGITVRRGEITASMNEFALRELPKLAST
jgi:hypothetical protein